MTLAPRPPSPAIRATCLLPVLAFLFGCASTAAGEGARFIGFIEKVNTTVHSDESAGVLFAFDASGGLTRDDAAARRTQVYGYLIATPAGEVTAHVDEKFALGDCVEVSGRLVTGMPRAFTYGETRMTRSSRCGTRY